MPRSDPAASQPLSVVLPCVVGMASGVALGRLPPLVPSSLPRPLAPSCGDRHAPR